MNCFPVFIVMIMMLPQASVARTAEPIETDNYVTTPHADYPIAAAGTLWRLRLTQAPGEAIRLRYVALPVDATLLETGASIPFEVEDGTLVLRTAPYDMLDSGSIIQLEFPPSRWRAQMDAFMEADQTVPAMRGGVLFTGSSTARMWNVEASFPGLDVLNRGFGGSEFADVFQFAREIVGNHAPETIVLYSGDNDIQGGKPVEWVFADCIAAVAHLQKLTPQIRIILLAIKPSASRWDHYPAMQQVNALMADYAETREPVEYLDLGKLLLDVDGKPDPECYLNDALHLSEEGYRRWSAALHPLLRDSKSKE